MSLLIFLLGGLSIATIFGFEGVQNSQWYMLSVATLLATGLYGSTFGISIKEARDNLGLIVRAVTVGVLLKALIIGATMSLILHTPFGFVLGIIVAQIDPLSMVSLMKPGRMSKRAQAILNAWASFDDPITVILALYVPGIVAAISGTHLHLVKGSMQDKGLAGYLAEMSINILFAGGVFACWKLARHRPKKINYLFVTLLLVATYGLLAGSMAVAIYYFWMLGMALVGLFLRPPIESMLSRAVQLAASMAAVLLGILLVNGIDFWKGLALGFAAYGSQIIVGLLLTRALPKRDQLHIAFAQQNGITAIILALLFEQIYPGTTAIVAPAIIAINVTHAVANQILDIRLEKSYHKLKPDYYLNQLRAHLEKI